MVDQNTEVKLKNLLKQEKVQLWNPPYTEQDGHAAQPHMQALAERYAAMLALPPSEVSVIMETIRVQAVRRGREKRMFRETSVASLDLLLPRVKGKEGKRKSVMETRLDVPVQQLVDRIGDEFGIKNIKLILNGKTLNVERPLWEEGVQNHSKLMVLKLSDGEWKQEEEKRRSQQEVLRRTQRGFSILSDRDGSDDGENSLFLEIADQKGNTLDIPHRERKALIVAIGFHDKGRSLMKKNQNEDALLHLLTADQYYSECGSTLLATVDNYAVLQLDIVWTYYGMEALSCLQDGRRRLERAEEAFTGCYGEHRERLIRIKGSTGREEVLFLRLHLLQSLLSYMEGDDTQAEQQLRTVESLYSRVCVDSEKVCVLMELGYTERESRLGLRATQGDLQGAAQHIAARRLEREELKQREVQKRRSRKEALSSLTELGFSRKDAAEALRRSEGDADAAYAILAGSSCTTSFSPEEVESPRKVEQLLHLGFDRADAVAALSLSGGDVEEATQLLLDHNGVIPPELLPPPSTSSPSTSSSPSSEEHTSSSSSPAEEAELVKEVLEDISPHEEDYLDLTLEEEAELIATLRSHLSHQPPHRV